MIIASLLACSSSPTDVAVVTAQIEVVPSYVSLRTVGDSAQLLVRDKAATIDLSAVRWQSLDNRVVTVTKTGKVIAKGRGRTRVVATVSESSDTVTADVGEVAGATASIPAFPGAEGFGATAFNRCDRANPQVLFVTNLADDGSGSLRNAVGASDPDRLSIVIFRTGGTIVLRKPLVPEKGCLYIAGQTAPGSGIQLRSPDDELHGVDLFNLQRDQSVSDVAVRYLRIRNGRGDVNKAHNFNITSGYRIIFDHISTAWSNANNGMVYSVRSSDNGRPAEEVTIQWSMITTGLTPHSVGLLIGAHPTEGPFPADVTVHHNAFIHNANRNPLIRRVHAAQVINNVVYNWKGRVGNLEGGPTVDLIGNYWKRGPWTEGSTVLQAIIDERSNYQLVEDPSLFMSDNVGDPWQLDPKADQTQFIQYGRERSGSLPGSAFVSETQAHPAVSVTLDSPFTALERVLERAGASSGLTCDGSWVPRRDALDEALVQQVRSGSGPSSDAETDHQADYGGFPTMAEGVPCPDADLDGLPDAWEERYQTDPNEPSDARADFDGDGYRNIEEYVNGTSPR